MTLPVLQHPTIHSIPDVNLIEYPEPQIVTLEEFKYFDEACSDFKVAGQEDEYSEDELVIKYPGLKREDACGFAVYGLPTHQWLNMEQDINTTTGAIETLRELLKSANRQLLEQYEIINKSTDEIKETFKDR